MAQKTIRRSEEVTETSLTVLQSESDPAEYEKWLYNNPEALADVKRGLADSAVGRGVKMSFLEYADSDIDD